MNRDSRRLFDHLTVRKPYDWSEVKPKPLFAEQEEALKLLPRIHVGPTVGTFDEIFVNENGVEYILIRELDLTKGRVEAYYVNTEGYDYARYVFRLPESTMDVLKIEGNY